MLSWATSWFIETDASDSEKRKEVSKELRRNKRLLENKNEDLELDLLELDEKIKQGLVKSGGKVTTEIKLLLQSKCSLNQQRSEISISANNNKYIDTRSTLDSSAATQARAIHLMTQLNQGLASKAGQSVIERDFERYAQQTGSIRKMQSHINDLMQADAQATVDSIQHRSASASSDSNALVDLNAEERILFEEARREYMLSSIPDAEAVDVFQSLPSVPTELPSLDARALSFTQTNNEELTNDDLSFM